MSSSDRVAISFRAREIPLVPVAAAARGGARIALLDRLLERDDASLARLSGVGSRDVVIVLGEGLPWVDGIVYLGHDPSAPSLLLPTNLVPDVPLALFERALMPRFSPPIAVLVEPRAIVSVAHARPLDRKRLVHLREASR